MTDGFLSNSAMGMAAGAADEARVALQPLQERADALAAALKNVNIRDEEDLRRTADKIALSRALREEADKRLDPIRTPYRDSDVAVRNVGSTFASKLAPGERDAQNAINSFRARQREAAAKAKQDQLDREAQLRKEAGLDAPAAPQVRAADVKLESVRGDLRSQVFDRAVIEVRIVDPRALPDTILNAPGVVQALEKAVRQMAKLTKDITGAEITDGQASSVKVK